MSDQLTEKEIYYFDGDLHMEIIDTVKKCFGKAYFKKVKVSYIAAMKMLDHAIRGNKYEIIGYLIGHVRGDTVYVLDTFEIPLKGTEARVEVADSLDGMKMMEMTAVNIEMSNEIGKEHPYIGWYHSHPGFGCWLSEIDVRTQTNLQMVNKTWLAIVVDPYKSIRENNIDMGCFMIGQPTAETEVKPTLPSEWVKSFGNSEKKYYKLEHSYFCSSKEKTMFDLINKSNWSEDLSVNMIKRNENVLNKEEKYLGERTAKAAEGKKKAPSSEEKKVNQEFFGMMDKVNNIYGLTLQQEYLKAFLFDD